MRKLIVSVPDELEERLRLFAYRKGDLSRLATEALTRRVAELEKQRLKELKSAQRNVGEYYKEKKFGNLVIAQGRFTLDRADIQVVIDDLARDAKLDELLAQKERESHRGYEYVNEVQIQASAEQEFCALLKDRTDEIKEWAANELKENGVNGRVRISFDPEEAMRFCECGYPAKEFSECSNCGSRG